MLRPATSSPYQVRPQYHAGVPSINPVRNGTRDHACFSYLDSVSHPLHVMVQRPALRVLSVFLALLLVVACAIEPEETNETNEMQGDVFESELETFELVQVASGLEHPWAIALLPDGRMVVTERPGRVNIVDQDGQVTPLSGLPEISTRNQGGLLDVVLHPDYESTGWIYMTYSKPVNGQSVPALMRARIDGTELVDLEEIFESNEPTSPGRHYGSRLLFLDDGTLLMTTGDRGQGDPSQDVTTHSGATLRLNDDGTAPDDNPEFDEEGVVPELYTYGHRNPQGMAMHPETGEVWQHEHGPRGGDELNVIVPGENYGWPVASWGRDYQTGEQIGVPHDEAPEMMAPVDYWDPSIAPSGMAFYSGDEFPNWQNHAFIGALSHQKLVRVELDGHEVVHQEILLEQEIGRIREVELGPDGFLYLLNDESDAGIFRLEPVQE